MESLKKNTNIREFVNDTLMEKIGDTRTVDRILEIMGEKFDRNVGEKMIEVLKKISGEGFKTDESTEKILDKFEQMMIEMDEVKLAQNLKYAMGLQLLERLEKMG